MKEIPVHCAFTRMVLISELKPNPRNPKPHPEAQIAALAEVIARNGWRSPIVVSASSGMITKGHARHLAAQRLGVLDAPVDFQEYETPADEWADVIADNAVAELARLDMEAVDAIRIDLGGLLDPEALGIVLQAAEPPVTPPPAAATPSTAGSPVSRGPRASDDGYAEFSLVMERDKKARLVTVLDQVRTACKVEKLEDAMMRLCQCWEAHGGNLGEGGK